LFSEGLALAERIPIPERIAGLTANLGLVARARGQTGLAQEYFLDALARAEALGAHYMVASIQLWLAPLLSPDEARELLSKARALIEEGADPNEVVILSEFRDLEQARQYAQLPELRQAMQRAGVISQPVVLFLEEA
jgi:hypothetical protein